ncbi:hypothetical protein B0T22DRAFT_406849 [Podospora appendiculata]|uniref:Uncharacterized protein n=1 Tax=Podospora appendiculata TaxID=314037 RepID=A0AAE0X9V0_9PEZI|nr:hypothetical protein B0T22DRAFT_406849 [Podospora appendiculata]
MGGSEQPFTYAAVRLDDSRFPAAKFDPKAVTRASYEPKPQRPKRDGPLVSFNRHPDAHMAPSQRSRNFMPMGRRTKAWIVHMRSVQMCLRVLELVAAVGLLVLMILINNVDPLTGWIVRITLGVAVLHCTYAIYHLSRRAGGRAPASSGAYHLFAGVSDLCVVPLYAFGALANFNNGIKWGTVLGDRSAMRYLLPAVYYGLITAGGLHVVSLAISIWLSFMFRRINLMPPDMNPLESHLTSRAAGAGTAAHKRNKSSIATSSYAGSERNSGVPAADDFSSRPPSVPFMHTRRDSQTSLATRDSRVDLPSRQYQVSPSNSPRNSATSQELKRMSAPPRSTTTTTTTATTTTNNRASYTEVPLAETRPTSSYSRPSSGTVASYRAEPVPAAQTAQPRAAKFTEAWYASESLVNRTQERTRALNQMNAANKRRAYEALNQTYDSHPNGGDNDSDSETEHRGYDYDRASRALASSDNETNSPHPNPLRSNPPSSAGGSKTTAKTRQATKTPFAALRNSILSLNDRSQDIADGTERERWQGRNRDSSIQCESDFYSKPYGQLKPGTPPIILGSGSGGSGGGNRVVSSGNDYDLGSVGAMGRRNVSGKVAEEGRAGQNRYSRYSGLNE